MLDDNYYVVQGWMRNKLGLSGNELIVYAIIYGFSQNEEQFYNGGLKYLSDAVGSHKTTVLRNIDALIEKGLIEKTENYINGIKVCSYKALNSGSKMQPVVAKCNLGGSKMQPNNKNINNNKENITNVIKEKKSKTKYGTYNRILLFDYEYEKLCSDFGKKVVDKQIDLLDEYIESNNNKNKYTNFNLVIRKSLREKWFEKKYYNGKAIKKKSEPDWLQDYIDHFEEGVETL